MIKNIIILVILGLYACVGSAVPQADINQVDQENQADQAAIELGDYDASWARGGRGGRGGHRHANRNGHRHGSHRDSHSYNGHNRGGHNHDDTWRRGRHRDHRKSWNTRGMTGYSSYGGNYEGGYEGGYAGDSAYVEEFPVAQGVIQPVGQAGLAPVAPPAPAPAVQPAPVAQPIL